MSAPASVQAKLGSVAPFFISGDIERSITFYVEKLGFTLSFKGPDENPYFGIVERDGARFMLKAIAPDVPPMPNPTRHEWARWDAYVGVDDPDALFEEVHSRGVMFHSPLAINSDNLRGFEVADADGYILYFGRPAKPGDSPIAT